MLTSTAAYADGWNCQTYDDSLNIKIYNHTQPEEGTRNAAIMVLSDPNVQYGRKTIAVFKKADGTLVSDGAKYQATVDHRFVISRRKGELIGGTKIGFLKEIKMYLFFQYSEPVAEDELVQGLMTLVKRNGQNTYQQIECARYLKGE